MAYEDLQAVKQHLDGLVAAGVCCPEEDETLEAAQQRFLAAGPEICAPLTIQLWAHYESLAPMWAMEENEATRIADQVPSLSEASQVWAHVDLPYPPEIFESQVLSGAVNIPVSAAGVTATRYALTRLGILSTHLTTFKEISRRGPQEAHPAPRV